MALLDSLLSRFGGDTIGQLSRSIGSDEASTKKAVGTALPMLLEALSRNADSRDGAAALDAALERDHDGGMLDHLGSLFQGDAGGKSADGDGILKHILGPKRAPLEAGLSKATGLDLGSVGALLPMLAPVLMAALGQEKQQRGLDVAGLMGMLSGEKQAIERKAPGTGGLLSSFLDQDGDGDLDLADAAKGLFSKFSR